MSDKGNFGVELAKLALILDTIGSYQKSDPIYHYTSPQGLLGILQPDNPVLWFSRYDALNDKTEGGCVIYSGENSQKIGDIQLVNFSETGKVIR